MFLPITQEDVRKRGWDSLDVIIISGDTYIDSSSNGAAIIGHWLIENGFRVGMICQPDVDDTDDILRLGIPKLFWSITAGNVDSMVANYTPTKKHRRRDDSTPGGINNKRPDRACIVYANLVRRVCKDRLIVLGGIEATLRRLVHYDYWSNSIRRSILFDAKADVITYGMGERSNLQLAQCLRDGQDWQDIRGICYISKEIPDGYLTAPSYMECCDSADSFVHAFRMFYENNDPITAKGIAQMQDTRYLVQNPPSYILSQSELDRIYELDYENAVHPYYLAQGEVRAMETIRNSVTASRGCYGECNFCAIAMVQGRTVVSRSEESIIREVERIASSDGFKGYITDVGGATANMYGFECKKKLEKGACTDRRCLYPVVCPHLPLDHSPFIHLLEQVRSVPGVKKVSIASGIRYDLIMADERYGKEFLTHLCEHHVSGQMKVAPEHISDDVLRMMGKPGSDILIEFKNEFDRINKEIGKEQYLTYYLIAAHPGCREKHMKELSGFCSRWLRTNPEQVQIFSPTPSTISTLMYCTGKDMDGNPVWSEHNMVLKQKQKDIILKPERKNSNAQVNKKGQKNRASGHSGKK